MKKKALRNRFLFLFFILVFMFGCKKTEYESLSFYHDYREVPVYRSSLISPKTGSGNYTLEIENPLLLSAETQSGWSGTTGMIAIYGRLTGNTSLTVTDNVTKESQNLRIKVTDNYETLRILKYSYYNEEQGKTEEAPLPPALSNMEWIYLVNNNARDFYLVNKESISLTDYVLKVRGKGNYTIRNEGADFNLKMSFPVDENGQPTLNMTNSKIVSYNFLIRTDDYGMHRLNQNLNLGYETSMPDKMTFRPDGDALLKMVEVNSDYKLSGVLSFLEMPVGFL